MASIEIEGDTIYTSMPAGTGQLRSALKEALEELHHLKSGSEIVVPKNYVAVKKSWVREVKKVSSALFGSGWVGCIRLSQPKHAMKIKNVFERVVKDKKLFVDGVE